MLPSAAWISAPASVASSTAMRSISSSSEISMSSAVFSHFATAFCDGCFTGMRTFSLSFSQAISATCFLSRLP